MAQIAAHGNVGVEMMHRKIVSREGLPLTLVTTDPAPITAQRPIDTGPTMCTPAPIQQSSPIAISDA
jgi:hypothetical protein